MSITTDAVDSPTRRRTRSAIVEAAVRVWARDFSASLGAVADEAGVSRSTLHRYYADRPTLEEACFRAALQVFDTPDCPGDPAPVLDQLRRTLEHAVSLGHWVLFLWSDPQRFSRIPDADFSWTVDESDPTVTLIRRGQDDGELDAGPPAEWLVEVYYSVIYCAAERVVRGASSPAEAARLAARTMDRAFAAQP